MDLSIDRRRSPTHFSLEDEVAEDCDFVDVVLADGAVPVNVNLVRNGGEYVAPPKPSYTAFSGQGRTLSGVKTLPSCWPVTPHAAPACWKSCMLVGQRTLGEQSFQQAWPQTPGGEQHQHQRHCDGLAVAQFVMVTSYSGVPHSVASCLQARHRSPPQRSRRRRRLPGVQQQLQRRRSRARDPRPGGQAPTSRRPSPPSSCAWRTAPAWSPAST